MKPRTSSELEAERKIMRALRHIEYAQAILQEACIQLAPIAGFGDVHEEISSLHDRVKAGWHQVNRRMNGGAFDLDSSAKRKFDARQALMKVESA